MACFLIAKYAGLGNQVLLAIIAIGCMLMFDLNFWSVTEAAIVQNPNQRLSVRFRCQLTLGRRPHMWFLYVIWLGLAAMPLVRRSWRRRSTKKPRNCQLNDTFAILAHARFVVLTLTCRRWGMSRRFRKRLLLDLVCHRVVAFS